MMMLVGAIFRTAAVFAIAVQPREEFGTIQNIDFQMRRLTITLTRGGQTVSARLEPVDVREGWRSQFTIISRFWAIDSRQKAL